MPLARRYKADRSFAIKRLEGRYASDTFFAKTKSLTQNTCAQIFSHQCGFKAVYPMVRLNGENVGKALRDFIDEFGAPETLIYDEHMTQVGRQTQWMKTITANRIDWHVSQPYQPRQNPAEAAIRELKKRWYRLQLKTGAHDRVWDFGTAYVAETERIIVSSARQAKGRTPLEIVSGITPDISEYLDFGF